MLLKLNGHISNCLERATDAEHRALEATDSATRSEHELLAQSWRHLARSYQFVESLERFLADTARGKSEVAPPEALAVVPELPPLQQQPAAPQSQPVIRRRRVRQELSFRDRLMKTAQDAREQAAGMPSGPARDHLLHKARQSETAADIETWVSTPGSRPPENFNPPKKPRV